MRRWALVASAATALIGAAVSAVSISQHFRIQREGLEEASFCAISATFNCDIVNASSYSEFLGIPVAGWGLIFYAMISAAAFAGLLKRGGARGLVASAWFFSLPSIPLSAYFAYIGLGILRAICIECLALYAINAVLVILLSIAQGTPLSARGAAAFVSGCLRAAAGRSSSLGFRLRLPAHVAAALIVLLIGWTLVRAAQAEWGAAPDKASVSEKLAAFYMQSLYSVAPDPSWPMWGNQNAKVVMIEFSEFECPFCRIAAFNLKPRLKEFERDMRLYFVNYPLDQSCNADMERPMHKSACMAARAGVCANERGDFWDYHDDVFRGQKRLGEELFLSLAAKRGWDRDEFKACMDSARAREEVERDLAAGRRAFVSGTPMVILGDRKLKYWRDWKFLRAVVKEEIKRAKAK